jgi:phage-related minor tail protein
MARVHHVKKALKDYPDIGVKKGEPYYWWAFRFGGKHRSKTPPKASQLTQSEFLGAMADIEERIQGIADDDLAAAKTEVEEIVSELESLASEQEDKLGNMPDGLQQGSTGELLQSRADTTNEMASELEGIDLDLEKEEGETDEEFAERVADAIGEVKNTSYGGE